MCASRLQWTSSSQWYCVLSPCLIQEVARPDQSDNTMSTSSSPSFTSCPLPSPTLYTTNYASCLLPSVALLHPHTTATLQQQSHHPLHHSFHPDAFQLIPAFGYIKPNSHGRRCAIQALLPNETLSNSITSPFCTSSYVSSCSSAYPVDIPTIVRKTIKAQTGKLKYLNSLRQALKRKQMKLDGDELTRSWLHPSFPIAAPSLIHEASSSSSSCSSTTPEPWPPASFFTRVYQEWVMNNEAGDEQTTHRRRTKKPSRPPKTPKELSAHMRSIQELKEQQELLTQNSSGIIMTSSRTTIGRRVSKSIVSSVALLERMWQRKNGSISAAKHRPLILVKLQPSSPQQSISLRRERKLSRSYCSLSIDSTSSFSSSSTTASSPLLEAVDASLLASQQTGLDHLPLLDTVHEEEDGIMNTSTSSQSIHDKRSPSKLLEALEMQQQHHQHQHPTNLVSVASTSNIATEDTFMSFVALATSGSQLASVPNAISLVIPPSNANDIQSVEVVASLVPPDATTLTMPSGGHMTTMMDITPNIKPSFDVMIMTDDLLLSQNDQNQENSSPKLQGLPKLLNSTSSSRGTISDTSSTESEEDMDEGELLTDLELSCSSGSTSPSLTGSGSPPIHAMMTRNLPMNSTNERKEFNDQQCFALVTTA